MFKSAKDNSDYATIYYTDGNGVNEKGILTIACENNNSEDTEDQIRFQTSSGTDRLTIAGNGNIGIGTTSPTQLLDIQGNISLTSKIIWGTDQNELEIGELDDDIIIKNTISDKDIIFNLNNNETDTEVFRIDGSESSILLSESNKVQFRDSDIAIYSSQDGQLNIIADEKLDIDIGNKITN